MELLLQLKDEFAHCRKTCPQSIVLRPDGNAEIVYHFNRDEGEIAIADLVAQITPGEIRARYTVIDQSGESGRRCVERPLTLTDIERLAGDWKHTHDLLFLLDYQDGEFRVERVKAYKSEKDLRYYSALGWLMRQSYQVEGHDGQFLAVVEKAIEWKEK